MHYKAQNAPLQGMNHSTLWGWLERDPYQRLKWIKTSQKYNQRLGEPNQTRPKQHQSINQQSLDLSQQRDCGRRIYHAPPYYTVVQWWWSHLVSSGVDLSSDESEIRCTPWVSEPYFNSYFCHWSVLILSPFSVRENKYIQTKGLYGTWINMGPSPSP